MNQNEMLLKYLKTHASINPLQAWKELSIYRLGARIYDLKRAGHRINTVRQSVTNQFGKQCVVANYRISRKP